MVCQCQIICSWNEAFIIICKIHQYKFRCIPNLISKVTICFNAFHIEAHIVTRCITSYKSKTQCISTILVDNFKRVNTIAQGFTHFTTLAIAHKTMNKYMFKWNFMFKLKSHEDHTSNPEEDDIVTSYKNTCWIPLFKFWCLFRPPHSSKWPQTRAKPCIKNVWILCYMAVTMWTFSNIFTANDCFAAVITVPCRNAMAPPQLTGNCPVADVFKPVYISFCKTFRNKLYFVVFNNLKSWLC